MVFQPFQTFFPEELVDFEDQRRLYEGMLDHSAKKRLMFVQASGTCGKTSFLNMARFHCEQENIPCCWIDFRGKSYDSPHFTLAHEICDQLGLSPSDMAQALQYLSISTPGGSEATMHINGNVSDSNVINQVLMTVNLNHDELRKPYMRERLIRAFIADLRDFASRKGCVACLFDHIEDISTEDERWLLDALLSPIAGAQFKGVMVVVAGRRWPKIEPLDWEKSAYLIDSLPRMSVEHIKSYAKKVGVEITHEEAEFCWQFSGGGNPQIMGIMIKHRVSIGWER